MFGSVNNNRKHWEYKGLELFTTIITYGLTIRPQYVDKGVDLISAKEIRKGYIDYVESPKITETDFNLLSNKAKPVYNDILFSKTGSIGHCALVTSNKPFAITQNAARIGLNCDMVNPLWILYYLKTDYIQDWCIRHAKGNAVKDFQLKDMRNIPVPCCPIDLQNKFADFVAQVDKSKLALEDCLFALNRVK